MLLSYVCKAVTLNEQKAEITESLHGALVIIWLGEEFTTDHEALCLTRNIRNFINENQEVPVNIFGTIDHEASGILRAGSPS